MTLIHIPLTQIDMHALPRDRSTLPPAALAELQSSIATEGLRQPIEVWRLSTPSEGHTYGLISGMRRLTSHKNLAELRGNGDFTTIAAFVRTPNSLPEALAAMVTENEIRSEITPWEKGLLILNAVEEDIFETPDAAIAGLFPHTSPSAKSRLRTIVQVVQNLNGILNDPTTYSLRQLLRIAAALKADFADVIEVALREAEDRSQAGQWEMLQNILTEAELSLKDPTFDPPPPRRAKRISRPRVGLTIRREWLPNGWRLVFTGPEAKGMMIDSVMGEIERMYGPPD
jgi:ParB family chromosome partitioning protein